MVQVKIERIKTPSNKTLYHYLSRALPEVEKAMSGPVKSIIMEKMENTVSGWNSPAKFSAKLLRTGGNLVLEVVPTGPNAFKWRIIGGGLGPRNIVSSKNLMSFPAEYSPSTRPGGKWGRKRRKYGDMVWNRREVGPHKIEAREFSKEIIKQKRDEIVREIAEAFSKATGG